MPSWRNARVVSPMASVGKSAKQIEMSIAVMTSSTERTKSSTRNAPSSSTNFMRFSDARLQLELSRCRYSEHGLDAVMRPDSGEVCQSLIVSSYCRPGSAHSQAASAISRNSDLASTVSMISPVVRERSPNSAPDCTARMNSSETRTELLAFWYCTDVMSDPPRSMSNPASRSTRILRSSSRLVPAEASAPRMNDTGPEAVPPEDSSSFDERMRERFSPAPEPPLKISPSSRYQLRIDSIVSSTARMKHALTCCGLDVPTLNHTGELKLKYWCSSIQVSSWENTSA